MDPSQVAPLDDVSPADWLLEQLVDFGGLVQDVVPTTYEAVARVLHRTDRGPGRPRRWGEVAAYCGTTLHPLAQYWMLSGGHARSTAARAWPHGEPDTGSLDRATLATLRDLTARHTAMPEQCWFALWEGYESHFPPSWRDAPTFGTPHRGFHLFRGALADVVEISVEFACAGYEQPSSGGISATFVGDGAASRSPDQHEIAEAFRASGMLQSPNLWWPEDRAWCVASEIDFDSTLVAGPRALVEELSGHPDLEAFEVGPGDSLQYDADQLNMR